MTTSTINQICANSSIKELRTLYNYVLEQGLHIKEGNPQYFQGVIELSSKEDEEYIFYALLHEYGHHLQSYDPNYSDKWEKCYQELDAWIRGEKLVKHLFPSYQFSEIYYIYKKSCLKSYYHKDNLGISVKDYGERKLARLTGKEYTLTGRGILPLSTKFVFPPKIDIPAPDPRTLSEWLADIKREFEESIAAIDAQYNN